MSVVWLLRHAEAQKAPGQSPEDLFSIADLGLSARGVAQAEAARDGLAGERIDAVYASPARRAQQTARIVAAPHGREVATDARLAELSVTGPDYSAILEGILSLPGRFIADPETFARERRAFSEALADIRARHEASLVVAHGLSNRAFLAASRGIPMPEFLTIPMEHASVTRLEV